jgi:hypothetical protein
MAITNIDQPSFAAATGDEAVPFNLTLAVADTSEPVAAVPVGKVIRAVTINNLETSASVFVNLGAAATLTSLEVAARKQLSQDGLAATSVEFIGEAGEQPSISGYLLVGPA